MGTVGGKDRRAGRSSQSRPGAVVRRQLQCWGTASARWGTAARLGDDGGDGGGGSAAGSPVA